MRRRAWILLAALAACTTRNPEAGSGAQPPAGDGTGEGRGPDVSGLPTTYPGTLVDIADVPRDFLMRQKLEGRWQDQKFAFEAVVQKQADKLTVIGMTPFGTKAFVLEQTGTDVKFEKFVDRDMPFPPEYILQDIHRAFLYDAKLPWGTAGEPGDNEAQVHDERVVDRFEDGRLVARSFARADAQPPGTITVTYLGDGMKGGQPPEKIEFRNGWFGYALDIKTVEFRPL